MLELVVFKLKEGATREQLLDAAEPVSEWVATQPGFISRDLCHSSEEDKWIDLIWWKSLGDARAAAELAMSSESCAPMFGLIDFDATIMLHGEPAASAALGAARSA